jgi:hypothetical protein
LGTKYWVVHCCRKSVVTFRAREYLVQSTMDTSLRDAFAGTSAHVQLAGESLFESAFRHSRFYELVQGSYLSPALAVRRQQRSTRRSTGRPGRVCACVPPQTTQSSASKLELDLVYRVYTTTHERQKRYITTKSCMLCTQSQDLALSLY